MTAINTDNFVAKQYANATIGIGDKGYFGMWNSNHVFGHIEDIRINRTGDTRVIFKKAGYRETFNVSSEHFFKWFVPAE